MSPPADVLAMARQLLDHASPETVGLWPRAASLLGRQALEMAAHDYWAARKIPLSSRPTLRELICLRQYVDDVDRARFHHASNARSRAYHQQPYELPPTAAELNAWFETLESWVAVSSLQAIR